MAEPAEADIVKGHCPQCGPNKNAYVTAKHTEREEVEEVGIWADTALSILKCAGCDTLYVLKVETCSEDIDTYENPVTGEWEHRLEEKISYWPPPSKRGPPEWHFEIGLEDSALGVLFGDVYTALNSDLRVLSAIGMRTAFDRASELLGVDPAISFGEKLSALHAAGKIGDGEKNSLSVLTDAGSAAAHRGWRPSLNELETMAAILEQFLYRNFILEKKVSELKANVPPKAPRRP